MYSRQSARLPLRYLSQTSLSRCVVACTIVSLEESRAKFAAIGIVMDGRGVSVLWRAKPYSSGCLDDDDRARLYFHLTRFVIEPALAALVANTELAGRTRRPTREAPRGMTKALAYAVKYAVMVDWRYDATQAHTTSEASCAA